MWFVVLAGLEIFFASPSLSIGGPPAVMASAPVVIDAPPVAEPPPSRPAVRSVPNPSAASGPRTVSLGHHIRITATVAGALNCPALPPTCYSMHDFSAGEVVPITGTVTQNGATFFILGPWTPIGLIPISQAVQID